MSATIQCPNCDQTYKLRAELAGKKVRCKDCGHAFEVPRPAKIVNTPDKPADGMDGLFDEAFGASDADQHLGGSAALDAGDPLAVPGNKPRRRRRMAADGLFLKLGIPLAAVGLILLFVFPLVGFLGFLATVLAVLPVVAGVGLIVYATRQNLPVAIGASVGAMAVLVVAFMIRPDTRTEAEVSRDLFVQLKQMPKLLESATDEATLKAVESQVVELYASMLKAEDRLSGPSDRTSPDGRSLDEAIQEFDERMRPIAARLPQIPGGVELAHELATLAKKTEVPCKWTPPPQIEKSEERARESLCQAFEMYERKNDQFAPDWDTLEDSLKDTQGLLTIAREFRAKGLIVQWGVKGDDLEGTKVNPHNFVRAYFKEDLEDGGWVIDMTEWVSYCGPIDLRERLNAQAPVVEAVTGVAPPICPPLEFKSESASLSVAAWVPSGWAAPPPPESPENRQQRLARQAADRTKDEIGDHVSILVTGIPGQALEQDIARKLGKIDLDAVVLQASVDGPANLTYKGFFVLDAREFFFRTDIGPIVDVDVSKGEMHVQFDPVRFDRWTPVAGRVYSAKAKPIVIPAEPEPPENQRRRRMWPKDYKGESSDCVRILVTDMPEDGRELATRIRERLHAVNPSTTLKRSGYEHGPRRWQFACNNVEDIREFARRINIGHITEFNESRGRIQVRLDSVIFANKPAAVIPNSPEPAKSVQQRRRTLEALGPSISYGVYVTCMGASKEDRRKISRIIEAVYPEGEPESLWRRQRDGNWVVTVEGVKDMRVFGRRLDLGKMTLYDEDNATIKIEVDPAKLANAPPPPAEPVSQQKQGAPLGPGLKPDPRISPDGARLTRQPQGGQGGQLEPKAADPRKSDFSTWSDATGTFRVEAKLIGNSGGKVTLRKRDARTLVVPATRLSKADQARAAASKPSDEYLRDPDSTNRDTELVGGTKGAPFRDETNQTLLGLLVVLTPKGVTEAAIMELKPLLDRRPAPQLPPQMIEMMQSQGMPEISVAGARAGYAVGALKIDADKTVHAIQIVFMRLLPDGRLDPKDSYNSEWYGSPTGNTVKTLSTTGPAVVGVYGCQSDGIDAIGLIMKGP